MLGTLRWAILKVWRQSRGIFHNLVHGFLQSKISSKLRTLGPADGLVEMLAVCTSFERDVGICFHIFPDYIQ